MDIVGKIGRYFASHEAQMRLVMQHALERSRHVPEVDSAQDDIARASQMLDECLSSFHSVPDDPAFSPRPPPKPRRVPHATAPTATTTSSTPTPPTAAKATTPRKPKRTRRKKSRSVPRFMTPSNACGRSDMQAEAAKAALEAERKLKLVEEALSVTKERARRIQMEKEQRIKAEAALLAMQQSRREAQLQQIEAVRKQAFTTAKAAPLPPAKVPSPRLPKAKPALVDAWTERSHKPRSKDAARLRSRLSSHAATMPTNQSEGRPTTPPARIDPITKFGPVVPDVPATPHLDRLEHMERFRAQRDAEVARDAQHRAAVAAAQAAAAHSQEAACARKAQQTTELERQREQLQAQKQALEAALLTMQTEATQLRAERHKLAMERRAARRAAAATKASNNDTVREVDAWTQDEHERAARAAVARNEAKRRVQGRGVRPTKGVGPETTESRLVWAVSPLVAARYERAFFCYSSSDDETENNE
ncbi:hypothetical protein ACHHYP_11122 [Achlya hypogyna]|uniref:Uncharacterized protein n=1 Tax=Achlya hypogyna TaxID=1202772 RepID=A0A1V9YJT1_ACHHY|nr:hypothetical protein ACHHYP_11122 [Achlya hypogyna]